MAATTDDGPGGAAGTAVRHHYDIGNAFYALWLDPSLTYSCALPVGPEDTLEGAQDRKLRYHLDAVRADRARSVLDVGCGWGSVLALLAEQPRLQRAVGLTLSEAQAAFIRSRAHHRVEVRTEDWRDYEPGARFDGIVSIGAFEHFARPEQPPAEKIRAYREFFTRCREWLHPGGALSLQTIGYADMSRADASPFMQQEIFPQADLPTLAEITAAADRVFEVVSLTNGRLDYAWTCERWAERLRARRQEAVALVGAEVAARYERYLRLSAVGFRMGKICLYRIVLRPYGHGHFGGAGRAG